MELNIDKVDINILYCLYKKNRTSPLYSAEIKKIIEFCNTSVSYHTVFRRTHKLAKEGYLANGYKNGRAITFYLTDKGEELVHIITDKEENIYEEISIDNGEE